MSSIDERVVEMKFNNAQFQKGVQDSTKSLDDLKKGLNLDGAKKGLDDLNASGKGFSLAGISGGAAAAGAGLVAMATIGITALANLTSGAIAAGTQLAKSLTVDPIMAGFGEYELKMGSIQTILANTARHGTNLEQVTSALDELNSYADLTIYNFGDMTRNIGLFTNAGLRVEEATSMIKGFSNEAAASGTSSQGAAGAAYQLSQALSAGTIRLMDWRSLTNVGMGNKNMQSGIIEIAEAMGAFEGVTTTAESATKDFNGSLETGWLSSEVMSNYLKIMAGDMDATAMAALGLSDAQIQAFAAQQKTAEEAATKVRTLTQLIGTMQEAVGSSWAQTFDLLFGNFDEATELFTRVNDTLGPLIGAAGEARNALIMQWDEQFGGREVLIEAITNAFNALMGVLTPLQEAFSDIFPPITAGRLFLITDGLRDFTEALVPGIKVINELKRTFRGVFAVFDILRMVIVEAVDMFLGLFEGADETAGGFLEVTAKIGDFLVGVRDAIKEGEGLSDFFDSLQEAISVPIEAIKTFIGVLGDLGGGFANIGSAGFEGILDRIGTRLAGLGSGISTAWEGLSGFFSGLWDVAQPILEAVGNGLGELGSAINDALRDVDYNILLDSLNTGIFAALTGGILAAVSGAFGGGGGGGGGFNILSLLGLDGIGESASGIVESVTGTIDALTGTLESMQQSIKADAILKIAIAVGVLAAAAGVLSLIDSGRLASALSAMTVMFGQLMGTMYLFEKTISPTAAPQMFVIAAAMIALGIAINILALAVKTLSSLSWEDLAKGMLSVTVLIGVMVGAARLLQSEAPKMMVSGVALIGMAIAIRILAESVKTLSDMDLISLATGLVGVGGLLAAISMFSNSVSAANVSPRVGVALVLMAGAIWLMAQGIKTLGGLDLGQMAGGIAAIGAVLFLISRFSESVGNPASLIKTAISLAVLGGALNLFAMAVSRFGAMDMETLFKGLLGMGASLLLVAKAMTMMPKSMLANAVAFTVVAAALLILSQALLQLGGMSLEQVGIALIALGGALLILNLALSAMRGAIPGAIALTIVAAGIALLVPALVALGGMSWDQIGAGLGALAIALGVIAVAALVITPILPALLALGVAVALLGAAALLAGAGVLAFGLGISALAAIGAAGAAAFTLVLTGLISLIPGLMTAIGQGLLAFAEVIATGGPAITAAITTVLLSILASIATVVPEIIDTLVLILSGLIEALITLIPQIVEMATVLITELVNALIVLVPLIIEAAVVIITALVNAIVELVPMLVDAAGRLITGILNGLANNIGKIIEAGTNLIVKFLDGIGEAIPRLIQAAADLVVDFLEGIASGIRNNTERIRRAGADIASAIIEGVTGGISNGVGEVITAARNMASDALNAAMDFLDINSPSRKFRDYVGSPMAEGTALGVRENAHLVDEEVQSMGDSALKTMDAVMTDLEDRVPRSLNLNPTITPVLDMSNVQKGAKDIQGTLQYRALNPSILREGSEFIAELMERFGRREETPAAGVTTNIKYEQTLNSPEALSAPTIYRQTKNQISKIKELIP